MITQDEDSLEDELLKDILKYAREAATAHSEVPVAKQIEYIENLLLSTMRRVKK